MSSLKMLQVGDQVYCPTKPPRKHITTAFVVEPQGPSLFTDHVFVEGHQAHDNGKRWYVPRTHCDYNLVALYNRLRDLRSQ